MKFLGKLFGNAGGGIIESLGNIADKFNLSGEEKQQFALDMETLVQKRDAKIQDALMTELQAKERIIVAELNQSDKYTKRARPTVVYMGLVFIAIAHIIAPIIFYIMQVPELASLEIGPPAQVLPPFEIELPTDFWIAWGGIVATWSVGRTFERRGEPKVAASTPKSVFSE